jgi:SNARE protein 1
LNKTGGKIGFWFLLKVLAAVFVTFFLMVALIKIFPKF